MGLIMFTVNTYNVFNTLYIRGAIIQLSTLEEWDMTVCLPEKDYVTRGWHKLSRHLTTVHIWQQIPSDDSYSVLLYLISQWRMKSSRDIIQLSCAVDITIRHNVQRLHTHIDISNLISLKNDIWHSVISTAGRYVTWLYQPHMSLYFFFVLNKLPFSDSLFCLADDKGTYMIVNYCPINNK